MLVRDPSMPLARVSDILNMRKRSGPPESRDGRVDNSVANAGWLLQLRLSFFSTANVCFHTFIATLTAENRCFQVSVNAVSTTEMVKGAVRRTKAFTIYDGAKPPRRLVLSAIISLDISEYLSDQVYARGISVPTLIIY